MKVRLYDGPNQFKRRSYALGETVALDESELRFCGMVETAAEGEFSASLFEDKDMAFAKELYARYVAEGKPKGPRAWISRELSKHFVCLASPPIWIERTTTPVWPFFNGRPMFFVGQITVSHSRGDQIQPMAGTELYIFGTHRSMLESPGGLEVVYRVIEQLPGI